MKAVYRSSKDTANKFRKVKWLRENHLEVQGAHDGLKGLAVFKTPKGCVRDVATRFRSKYDCISRSVMVNPATSIVMALPLYKAKYEDKAVDAPKDESDDEYEKKDKRKLSDVLRDCKANWVENKAAQKLAGGLTLNLTPTPTLTLTLTLTEQEG